MSAARAATFCRPCTLKGPSQNNFPQWTPLIAYRSFAYFFLVAIPPRMCRSCLFLSSTSLTFRYSGKLIFCKRSVISLCTVDFEISNFLAVSRTVAPVSIMYRAKVLALSSGRPFKSFPPSNVGLVTIYGPAGGCMCVLSSKKRLFSGRRPAENGLQSSGWICYDKHGQNRPPPAPRPPQRIAKEMYVR